MSEKRTDHRGKTDWGGIVVLVVLLSVAGLAFAAQSVRIALSDPSGGLVLALLVVGMIALIWLISAFFWARGQLRVRAVRHRFPEGTLIEVVMTDDLAVRVLNAEQQLNEPTPVIWPKTYLTVVATPDALWFFGGSFRAVLRGRIPASAIGGVGVRIADFPTQTVTRHFPSIVIDLDLGKEVLPLEILPLRTTLFVVRKLKQQQLDDAASAIATSLGVELGQSRG